MKQGKAFWKSKTVWVNVIAIAAIIVNDVWGYELDPKAQGGILVIVNLVLRGVTGEPINWSPPEQR